MILWMFLWKTRSASSTFIHCKAAICFPNEAKIGIASWRSLSNSWFSENYSFVLPDAAQGFHCSNSQATIHPFVVYYKDSGELKHIIYVVISESLRHDTVAVHLFQKSLISFLKEKCGTLPQKFYYFSDRAASQYKNRKNFINLCFHEADFGVPAEWHFSAASHGKGACDGVGGTMKWLAASASLQRPYEQQIMTQHLNGQVRTSQQLPLNFALLKITKVKNSYWRNDFSSHVRFLGQESFIHSILSQSNSIYKSVFTVNYLQGRASLSSWKSVPIRRHQWLCCMHVRG